MPLYEAAQSGLPTIILYIFEPSIMSDSHMAMRHWRFIYQSLEDLTISGLKMNILYGDALDIFNKLSEAFQIEKVLTHLEVGLKPVYDRNIQIEKLLDKKGIELKEYSSDGIHKRKQDREYWEDYWYDYMLDDLKNPDLDQLEMVTLPGNDFPSFDFARKYPEGAKPRQEFQQGGESIALRELQAFVHKKAPNYLKNLSSMTNSRIWGSRLSSYLSYGCISLRDVYQSVKKYADDSSVGKNYQKYLIRLFWRSHYIQKLETEWELEFQPTNPALDSSNRDFDDELFKAWSKGLTGYPLIDASMKCLEATGFVSFRQRAMLITFATFTLWQDWRAVSIRLATLFLDFEPGIHYGQIHLQAGLTGYHTLRIFNPVLQSQKHDAAGEFIKKWLPVFREVPCDLIHQPWKMNEEQQRKYNCVLGEDYPKPIVDYDIANSIAKNHYWRIRNREEVLLELPKIFRKHCLPKNIAEYIRAMELNLKEIKRNRRLGS